MYLTHITSGVRWCCLKSVPIIQSLSPNFRPRPMLRETLGVTPKSNTCSRYFHNSITCRQAYGRRGNETRLILEHEYSVPKDTVLYKYDNSKFIKLINLFALSQFFFWGYLSHFAFTMMKDMPVSEEDKNNPKISWWRKINFGQFKTGITIGCFFIGWGTMAVAWMYTLRCVRLLILKKGGENLVFVTFSPFNRNRSLTVPLQQVSAKQSRMSARVYLPLKVQGRFMYYILDMQGEFLNSKLFDYSAGLQRNWKM